MSPVGMQAGTRASRRRNKAGLPEPQLSPFGNFQLHLLRLLERAELRRHLRLGAATKQVIDGKVVVKK